MLVQYGLAAGAPSDELVLLQLLTFSGSVPSAISRKLWRAAFELHCDLNGVTVLSSTSRWETYIRSTNADMLILVVIVILQVDDGVLTFGVVSHPLRALESMIRAVYRPTLQGQDNRLWGKAPPDSIHEFMVSLDGFVDNMQVYPVARRSKVE